jgi:hypothetical protein
MNTIRFGIILLALSYAAAAAAQDADPRTAKITDRANSESQVSGLVVSNVDARFGFDKPDDHGRIVVSTPNIEWAIPLRAISSIRQLGGTTWTVTYLTKDGETMVSGALPRDAELDGNSDFGTFTLSLARLNRLEFQQPAAPAAPAKRPNIYDKDGHLRGASFAATLTLTDGTQLAVTQLRRNDIYAQDVTDTTVLVDRPTYAIVAGTYTDFRLLRGETLQTVPFENVKSAEFMPGDTVLVKTKGGAEAEMKIPRRDERSVEGFAGFSSKGDFYVPLRFVRLITFPDAAK